jgi:uridine phosphorylase
MSFPLDEEKYGRPAVMTAADLLAQRRRIGTAPQFEPPHAVILCYQPSLLRYGVSRQRGKKQTGLYGDFYLLGKSDGRIGIVGNFGVGAPVVAVLVEDLAAYGVKRFISIGIAGSVQETGRAGDLVIAEQALRDEGTSYHYLPADHAALANRSLQRQLERALRESGTGYMAGSTWTTDAPYRETLTEYKRHQKAGILTVEMEAAAFYVVAQTIGVEVCAAFCIGDTFAAGKWRLADDPKRVEWGLQHLFDAAVQALLSS